MSSDSVFPSARLKIERAYYHIIDLERAIGQFLETDFYRLHIESHPDGQNILVLEAKPISSGIAAILGDAIHNLRASLDHAVNEIVIFSGGTPGKYLDFPIRTEREKLVSVLNGGEIKAAGQNICDLILNEIQPHAGGNNDALLALHELDIRDKHRLVIPVVAATSLVGVSAEDENHCQIRNFVLHVGAGGRLEAFGSGAKMKITNHGKPAFEVFLPQGAPLKGQPLFPTLVQLAELVSGVVKTLEKAFFAKS